MAPKKMVEVKPVTGPEKTKAQSGKAKDEKRTVEKPKGEEKQQVGTAAKWRGSENDGISGRDNDGTGEGTTGILRALRAQWIAMQSIQVSGAAM